MTNRSTRTNPKGTPMIYTVALSKGGSGKTATAAELVAALARAGRRVLAIDLDRQGNLSTRLGLTDETEVEAVAADVLTGEATAGEAAVPSPTVRGVDVIAGTHDLADLDNRPEVITALRDYLPTLGEWDDVVIDTPPSLGLITMTALAAADQVVAAVECAKEAYDQVGELVELIDKRISRMHPGQRVHWFVPVMYDSRRKLDGEVVEALNEDYPGRVTPPVRMGIAVRDAYTSGQPVSVYAPRANVTLDYMAAMDQIITAR